MPLQVVALCLPQCMYVYSHRVGSMLCLTISLYMRLCIACMGESMCVDRHDACDAFYATHKYMRRSRPLCESVYAHVDGLPAMPRHLRLCASLYACVLIQVGALGLSWMKRILRHRHVIDGAHWRQLISVATASHSCHASSAISQWYGAMLIPKYIVHVCMRERKNMYMCV